MANDKINIIDEYFDKMIKNSWTYNKMTQEEKTNLYNTLTHNSIIDTIKGTKKQRYEILHAIYFSFLMALGYTYNWREESDNEG